jgi:hypothetical protein
VSCSTVTWSKCTSGVDERRVVTNVCRTWVIILQDTAPLRAPPAVPKNNEEPLSFSEAAAKGLEVYARAKIHDQEQELFEPRMRAMMRQEIRASDNRHLYFEMRNAIAAEQTRILITNLYRRQLTLDGLTQEAIQEKVDQAYTLARKNVLRKTPQLTSLLDAWWNASQDTPAEKRAGEGHGVGRHGSGNSGLYPAQ